MFNSRILGLSSYRFLKLMGGLLVFSKSFFSIIGLITFFIFSGFSQDTSINNLTSSCGATINNTPKKEGCAPTSTDLNDAPSTGYCSMVSSRLNVFMPLFPLTSMI
jgi:hypothetical protein